jgi:hypothetical protein
MARMTKRNTAEGRRRRRTTAETMSALEVSEDGGRRTAADPFY